MFEYDKLTLHSADAEIKKSKSGSFGNIAWLSICTPSTLQPIHAQGNLKIADQESTADLFLSDIWK